MRTRDGRRSTHDRTRLLRALTTKEGLWPLSPTPVFRAFDGFPGKQMKLEAMRTNKNKRCNFEEFICLKNFSGTREDMGRNLGIESLCGLNFYLFCFLVLGQ